MTLSSAHGSTVQLASVKDVVVTLLVAYKNPSVFNVSVYDQTTSQFLLILFSART